MTEKLVSIGKTAGMLGVSIETLRRWDRSGEFCAVKHASGHRKYKMTDIRAIQKDKTGQINMQSTAVYCRVSSHEQKEKGDLERQKGRVLEHCVNKSYRVEHILEDVGSGMNGNRPKLNKLIDLVKRKDVERVVIEHRDRLTRFQYVMFEKFFNSYGVEIEFISNSLPKSHENELVEDILALMASFSGKIYGMRSMGRRNKEANA